MKDEYFDLVTEDNVLTGEQVQRSRVHAEGLWHRTAHIYYFHVDNGVLYFLVHLRAKDKDLHPNRWDTRFGGHVVAGESIESTTEKEVFEEIGLHIAYSDLIAGPVRKRDRDSNKEFTYVFYLRADSQDTNQLHFEDNEVQEVKWLSSKEIIESMLENPEHWSGSAEGFIECFTFLEKSAHII